MSTPQPFEELLFTPGPTKIPERIFAAMHHPVLHHRTKEFERIFKETRELLQELLGAPPIMLCASGTGAMEAALINTVAPGDLMVHVDGGVFGARWGAIGRAIGAMVKSFSSPLGEALNIPALTKLLQEHPATKVLCLQQCETSTATAYDVAQIAQAAKKIIPSITVIVDGISSLCGHALRVTDGAIDIVIGGSQKAFGLQPGLSFLGISTHAWDVIEKTPRRSLYFDLLTERTVQERGTSAWTPAIGLILGLRESLTMILREEGLQHCISRHERMRAEVLAATGKMGIAQFSKSPAATVTALIPPAHKSADHIITEMEGKFHMRLAEGQQSLKGKIFRFGHMGFMTEAELHAGLEALQKVCA